jgi:hypothetical protein
MPHTAEQQDEFFLVVIGIAGLVVTSAMTIRSVFGSASSKALISVVNWSPRISIRFAIAVLSLVRITIQAWCSCLGIATDYASRGLPVQANVKKSSDQGNKAMPPIVMTTGRLHVRGHQ